MAVFKCKMCGGTLEINNNESVATCEYCGTQQTLPRLDDEKRANLYDRANHFRRNNEFDKAMAIYEKILEEDSKDAEAYWSLVLCRYGIEYVEDPASHKRIPTVNRAQFSSVVSDKDYKSALKYGDASQKEIYKSEARAIDKIQKEILSISQKEEPFDVFICYKETDAHGRRTPDSVLANDLYHQLTQEGFKVFFARITLEDKLGTSYEPYIFAALNSAKVMVVIGTNPEYFNAVWVKNEWSRYLSLVRQSDGKKMLIPAYKDMDPYDLPEEFSHLQAQDMSKLGFMQDLIRGIKKIAGADGPKTAVVKETVVTAGNANTNITPLLERAFMFLEDGEWAKADDFCEQVLNQDPKCAEAYLGKLMAELQVNKREQLADCDNPFDNKNNYQKVLRFGDDSLADELKGYIEHINERNENERLSNSYNYAVKTMNSAKAEAEAFFRARSRARSEELYRYAASEFREISGYKDADELAEECLNKAEVCRKDAIYYSAKEYAGRGTVSGCMSAIELFQTIPGWKDADEQIEKCNQKIKEIEEKEEADRLEAERKAEAERLEAERKAEAERLEAERKAEAERLEAEEKRIAKEKAAKKRKKFIAISTPVACVIIAFLIVLSTVIIPSANYKKGIKLSESGDYDKAIAAFLDAGNFKDADDIRAEYLTDKNRETISAEGEHTVGLKANGKVFAVGYNTAAGYNVDAYCDVLGWKDIVSVSTGKHYTVCLKSDGTVVAKGWRSDEECDVLGWRDIVAISAGYGHTVGLKSDGTVVAVGSNGIGQCDVSDWKDIVAISAGGFYTVGLKSDGTVVATDSNGNGKCNVSDWKDIVAISAGDFHTVGLKSDGTVVAVGSNGSGQCDVSGWKDIVAISAGDYHTVGLKSDGTVVAVGSDLAGQCDVSGWKDIMLPSQNKQN